MTQAEPAFQQLKSYLIQRTGLAYYADKDQVLLATFQEVMSEFQLASCAELYERLFHQPLIMDSLVQALTIGETYFFRHHEQLEALSEYVFPDLLRQRSPAEPLRIWSAGCATGEEPYSLAIQLTEDFPEWSQPDRLELLASDLNPRFIQQAREGLYRNWAFRQTQPSLRENCFVKAGAYWQLSDRYRKMVQFSVQNMFDTPADRLPFDLIICRNVLIYFDAETQAKIIDSFYRQLKPRGWLVLGPAELTPLRAHPFYVPEFAHLSCFSKARPIECLPQPSTLINPLVTESVPEFLVAFKPEAELEKTQNHPIPRSVDDIETAQRLADSGHLSAAADICLRLQVLEPLNYQNLYCLAIIRSSQGEPQDALNLFRRVLYLNRNHILSHYQMGLIYQQLGQPKASRRALRNAQQLMHEQAQDQPLPDSQGLLVSQVQGWVADLQEGQTDE